MWIRTYGRLYQKLCSTTCEIPIGIYRTQDTSNADTSHVSNSPVERWGPFSAFSRHCVRLRPSVSPRNNKQQISAAQDIRYPEVRTLENSFKRLKTKREMSSQDTQETIAFYSVTQANTFTLTHSSTPVHSLSISISLSIYLYLSLCLTLYLSTSSTK